MQFAFNVFLSAGIISIALWVARTSPVLGGFIVSLPIATLIVLALNKIQNADEASGFILAKSIFVGIPTTLLFFIPFLFAERLKIPFWICYLTGILLLVVGFFIHRYAMSVLK